MKTGRLGNSELEITTIGFGAWAIGGPWAFGWGEQDDEKSIRTIHKTLDLGVNWIDTAAVYGLGHSEKVVGKALKGRRNDVILATKCGLVWDDKGAVDRKLNRKSVRQELENSLRRLDVDYIDLYQIHWPTEEKHHLEVWEEMSRFVEEGKIRYAGVSNFSPDQMRPLLEILPITSLQPPYSMMVRDIEKEIFLFVKENNIGIVAYGPMFHGLLTGKYNSESIAKLPDDDWRKKNPQFNNPILDINLELVSGLKEIASSLNTTTAELSIAWDLSHKEVTSAIVGLRDEKQPEQIVSASDLELSSDILQKIQTLIDKREEAIAKIS